MITDPVELATQRELTRAFIAADHETIALTPRISQKTTTGGQIFVEQEPREPQDFKLIELAIRSRTETHVPGGDHQEGDYTLLGNWDAVIGDRDIFTHDGGQWVVVSLEQDNGYEKRATVRRHGR